MGAWCRAAVALAAACCVGFTSGSSQQTGVASYAGRLRPNTARIAILGDPHSGATCRPGGVVSQEGRALARMQTADVIAYRPDFVIVDGDLSSCTGGSDQACVISQYLIRDDVDSSTCSQVPLPAGCATATQDTEWTAFKEDVYDPLIAAGIPVFLTIGNHDSCVDFERWFPAAEWMTLPYARAVDSRANACGGATFSGTCIGGTPGTPLYTDTTHRSALFETPIGTICVVGHNDTEVDGPWALGQIGCGSGRPTLMVSHGGIDSSLAYILVDATTAQKRDVIAAVSGHYTCTGNSDPAQETCFVSIQALCSSGNCVTHSVNHVMSVFVNSQLVYFGNPATCPTCQTGGSLWSSWEIDPVANTATLQSHNPYLANTSDSPDPGAWKARNTTTALGLDFCTEYGGC